MTGEYIPYSSRSSKSKGFFEHLGIDHVFDLDSDAGVLFFELFGPYHIEIPGIAGEFAQAERDRFFGGRRSALLLLWNGRSLRLAFGDGRRCGGLFSSFWLTSG